MSNLEVKINEEGVLELLKSAEMQDICRERAEEIASKAGGGYEVSVHVGKTRCNASIYSTNHKSSEETDRLLGGIL